MVILHIVAPADVGGLERVVQALAAGHQRRGHHVAVAGVVTPGRAEPPLLASLRAARVEVHAVQVAGRQYLRERSVIGDLCRALRPDVVHTHGYRPDVVDAGVARRLGVPIVTTVHGFTGGGWKNRFYEYVQRRAFRRFDAVVVVSSLLGTQLARQGVPQGRIHVVRNAWTGQAPALSRADARRALGLPADGFLIGWVGRFTHEKGPDVLVAALAMLVDLPVTTVMLGAGPELGTVRAEAVRLGVADRTVFPGVVADAGQFLAAFDLFVLSSRTEGTPIALFEAIAAGTPVVASRVGGVPDVVSEREAMLVPCADAQALAEAVRAVVAAPSQARMRALAAQQRLATDFAGDPWLACYETVYRGACAPPRSRIQAGQVTLPPMSSGSS